MSITQGIEECLAQIGTILRGPTCQKLPILPILGTLEMDNIVDQAKSGDRQQSLFLFLFLLLTYLILWHHRRILVSHGFSPSLGFSHWVYWWGFFAQWLSNRFWQTPMTPTFLTNTYSHSSILIPFSLIIFTQYYLYPLPYSSMSHALCCEVGGFQLLTEVCNWNILSIHTSYRCSSELEEQKFTMTYCNNVTLVKCSLHALLQ